MKTKHPTKAQVQVVIDTLTKALPYAEKVFKKNGYNVSMINPDVDKKCGSPMCHAGWYAAIVYFGKKKQNVSYFEEGANLIAENFGFSNHYALEDWAKKNPKIWGNTNGFFMFSSSEAFGIMEDIDLSDIIKHWKGVKKRLPK